MVVTVARFFQLSLLLLRCFWWYRCCCCCTSYWLLYVSLVAVSSFVVEVAVAAIVDIFAVVKCFIRVGVFFTVLSVVSLLLMYFCDVVALVDVLFVVVWLWLWFFLVCCITLSFFRWRTSLEFCCCPVLFYGVEYHIICDQPAHREKSLVQE